MPAPNHARLTWYRRDDLPPDHGPMLAFGVAETRDDLWPLPHLFDDLPPDTPIHWWAYRSGAHAFSWDAGTRVFRWAVPGGSVP